MRYFNGALVALCVTAIMSYPTIALKLSPAEQEVVNVSKERMDAALKRDMAAWTRYVAEDCIFSTDNGTLLTKAQMLQYYRKVPALYDRAVDPRDYVVHVYGNTAVINYLATTHEQFGDTDIVSEQRRTETLLNQNGSWLLIAIQWDNLPVNFRKPVTVDARIYKDYIGQYQMRPGDDTETIFVKDGRLWSQLGDEVAEYLPASADTFFLKDEDLASFTFSRDAGGHVIGYTYHRIDGQEIHAQKIK